ncbi:uncharacterized protein LOC134254242 [Saccostrea cucullata]|uniref:uncharacterized protein LOC134254242 n=1 Tax=Saccostrea cuccullata TaxID=36930 RepID=UPI002ED12401
MDPSPNLMTKKRGRRKCSYKKIQIKDKLRKRKQRLARRLSSKLGITQEIEHLPTSEIGITQEIEHLSTSELAITQEREHLSTNEIGITQEIEHLSTSELGITQEREHLPTSEIGITQEIEHLSTSELGIAQERENLPTSELGITQEREHLSNSELEITEKEKKKNKVFSHLRDKIQKRRERDRARYLSKKLAREKENKEKRQGIQWSSTGDSTMKVKRQSPATKAKKNKVYRATVLKSRMETAKAIQTKVPWQNCVF